jgi:coenzyme F420-reducing hydrogenase gamma subunit
MTATVAEVMVATLKASACAGCTTNLRELEAR